MDRRQSFDSVVRQRFKRHVLFLAGILRFLMKVLCQRLLGNSPSLLLFVLPGAATAAAVLPWPSQQQGPCESEKFQFEKVVFLF
jgi:hypothetical protein